MEAGKPASYNQCGQERTEQQGEHLADDEQEGRKETLFRVRVNERDGEGDDERRKQVDENGVSGEGGCVSSELAGDDSCGRSCGAYQAYHDTFHNNLSGHVGEKVEEESREAESSRLYQQQPEVPCAGLQVVRVNLAEGDEEHGKDKQRLQDCDTCQCERFERGKQGEVGESQVADNACQHGDRKSPDLQKGYYFHRFFFICVCKDRLFTPCLFRFAGDYLSGSIILLTFAPHYG